jgi:threonine/homoserine/homoserine lactone efflux protein
MSSNGLGILLLIVMFCLVLTMILDPVTLSDRYWKIHMRVMFSLIFGGLIIALAIKAAGGQP